MAISITRVARHLLQPQKIKRLVFLIFDRINKLPTTNRRIRTVDSLRVVRVRPPYRSCSITINNCAEIFISFQLYHTAVAMYFAVLTITTFTRGTHWKHRTPVRVLKRVFHIQFIRSIILNFSTSQFHCRFVEWTRQSYYIVGYVTERHWFGFMQLGSIRSRLGLIRWIDELKSYWAI